MAKKKSPRISGDPNRGKNQEVIHGKFFLDFSEKTRENLRALFSKKPKKMVA